jgi:hypothetical protein
MLHYMGSDTMTKINININVGNKVACVSVCKYYNMSHRFEKQYSMELNIKKQGIQYGVGMLKMLLYLK